VVVTDTNNLYKPNNVSAITDYKPNPNSLREKGKGREATASQTKTISLEAAMNHASTLLQVFH
jgi:hypothetical protein